MRRGWGTALAGVAAAGLLAGCAMPLSPSADGNSRDRPPVKAAPRCTRHDGSFALHRQSGGLPAGLHPRAVVLCTIETRTRPDTSEWSYVVTKRATSGLDAFIRALREPDDPPPGGGVACPATAQVDPDVVVVDVHGAGYRPAFPRDECNLLKPDATTALAALPFRTVAAVPFHEVRSALSASSGCADGWKDMLALLGARAGAGHPASPDQPVLVCDFAIHPAQVVPSERGPGRVVAGTLTAGRRLSADDSTRLLHAIADAPVAPACSARHTRYAVVTGAGMSSAVYLELDGCRRLSSWTGGLRVVTPEIARLIDIG